MLYVNSKLNFNLQYQQQVGVPTNRELTLAVRRGVSKLDAAVAEKSESEFVSVSNRFFSA